MKAFLSKIWFPMAAVSAVTLQMSASHRDFSLSEFPAEVPDTVIYSTKGYKMYWTAEEHAGTMQIADSLLNQDSEGFGEDDGSPEMLRPAALDSLIPPDSLRLIDTFRFKYYAALRDSLCHIWVRDTLKAAGDSTDWPVLDSIYAFDSTVLAKAAYTAWYNSLDKKARKKADLERLIPIKQAREDSIKAVKESKQFVKDSILENTPRILETYVLPDSMLYKRILKWNVDQNFHNLKMEGVDTSYNYRFYDYPFQRKDVNATWLGMAGSPVQYFDYSKRGSTEGVFFYDAQEAWSYSPSTLTMYNSKTPYTELAYFGTLLAASSKTSDNLHLLTTQNISPSLNLRASFDRFGGEGMLQNEATANKTSVISADYLGKNYLMHFGFIHNKVSRTENGGVADNFWIRDTLVDAHEISVKLSSASSQIKKNTVFLDQQYRIPFYFIEKWGQKKKAAADSLTVAEDSLATLPEMPSEPEGELDEQTDSLAISAADSLQTGSADDITTAFIGHSSEYSVYTRTYQDKLKNADEKAFYHNIGNINPSESFDSLRVMKFDNKLFLRLQPWSEDGIVSKLNVGIGEKILNYYRFDRTYLHKPSNFMWDETYLYAGVEGRFKKYVEWSAVGNYVLLGDALGDFEIKADARLNIFPFRKRKNSPMEFDAHFSTSLKEPDYYSQHLFTNHYSWENNFSKISTTAVSGGFGVPSWNLRAEVNYNLLANNLYYNTSGIVCQNTEAMSVLSASVMKNFVLGKLHLDHRILAQFSSKNEIVPVPLASANIRYYLQFFVGSQHTMEMQIGANVWYNTAWYTPAWNPALGVFHNQEEVKYGNCPFVDAFVNMQWKRACIFIKGENINMGWPMEETDYFSAHHYIRTQRTVKLGLYWPFYTQSEKAHSSDKHND